MTDQFFDKSGKEVTLDAQIHGIINYKDYDYSNEPVKNIRQRLQILRRFGKGEIQIKYWDKLVASGKDSFGCFIEMVKNRYEIDFKFHDTVKTHNEIEWNWVYRKLQVNDKHRVEMLPENIDLVGLVRDLNEIVCSNEIMLNIGGCQHLLNNSLYSMNNLVWLNLSASQLTNSKVHSIFQVINMNRLKNLRGLVLTNNDGIKFEQLKNDLEKLVAGRLQYLETDLKDEETEMQREGDNATSVLELIAVGSEFKLMNDAKKIKYLIEIGIIEISNRDVLIDIGICDEGWTERAKLGLLDGYKSLSYKVNLNKKDAKLRERVVSEKISRSMVRSEFVTNLTPILKKRKNKFTGFRKVTK